MDNAVSPSRQLAKCESSDVKNALRVRGIMLTFDLPLEYRAWGAGGQDACCGGLDGCVWASWGSVVWCAGARGGGVAGMRR
jgi:hypothetical protein